MIMKVEAKSYRFDLFPQRVKVEKLNLSTYHIETFLFYWVGLCAVSGFMCRGWAVLVMDVQGGCHLQIASVKMIDPGPQRGRLKFTALEFNMHCAFPQVRYSADDDDDHSTDVCSSRTDGRARIQLAYRGWWLQWLFLHNICKIWLCVSVCKGERYSHYRWITKQALALPIMECECQSC